jgi:hypothetical protein
VEKGRGEKAVLRVLRGTRGRDKDQRPKRVEQKRWVWKCGNPRKTTDVNPQTQVGGKMKGRKRKIKRERDERERREQQKRDERKIRETRER